MSLLGNFLVLRDHLDLALVSSSKHGTAVVYWVGFLERVEALFPCTRTLASCCLIEGRSELARNGLKGSGLSIFAWV